MFIPLFILLFIPLFIFLLIPLFTQPPVTVRRWRTLTSPLGGTARWGALGGEERRGRVRKILPTLLPYLTPLIIILLIIFLTIDNTPFLYTYK